MAKRKTVAQAQPPAMTDYRDLLSGKRFDLIIADVPWSYARDDGEKVEGLLGYPTFPVDAYAGMMSAFYQALKPNRNMWCWCDYFTLPALLDAAKLVGFTYRALCVVKRYHLGLGHFNRKDCYFLPAWSKGSAYTNKAESGRFPEYLGEYRLVDGHKPQAVYERIIAHSLPKGGTWIDPFPNVHEGVIRAADGTIRIQPPLWGEIA